MTRDTTPNFEPHLNSRREGDLVLWYVRMKTGPGEFIALSDEDYSKPATAREMRRIRQEMARVWFASKT